MSFNSGPNVGDMNRRLIILRQSSMKDAMNSVVLTFTTLTTVWGFFSPISDGERLASGQMNAQLSARFQVRYSSLTSGITPKDRLQMDGLTYDIIGVKEIERRRWIEITAATRTDGG